MQPHFETRLRGIGLNTECRKLGVEIRFFPFGFTSCRVGKSPLWSALQKQLREQGNTLPRQDANLRDVQPIPVLK